MRIDHDMVLSSLGHTIEIVVVEPLTIVVLATWDDITYITTFHGIVAILIHQAVSSFEMTLIVADRSRSLVVHHQTYALGVSIVVEILDVEIWIRGLEMSLKHISEPTRPYKIKYDVI